MCVTGLVCMCDMTIYVCHTYKRAIPHQKFLGGGVLTPVVLFVPLIWTKWVFWNSTKTRPRSWQPGLSWLPGSTPAGLQEGFSAVCVYMCDTQDSFMCVTGLVCMCDMTAFVCVTWLVYMCGRTRSCVWRDWFICVIWQDGSVWHDSFTCVMWLTHVCDMTHSHVWFDSIHMCDMTRLHVWHVLMTRWELWDGYVRYDSIHMCDTPRKASICVTWKHSYVWHAL